MPAFRPVTLCVVHVQNRERADDGEVQPPNYTVGERESQQWPDEDYQLADTGSRDGGEIILNARERIFFQPVNQFAQRTVPFNRDKPVAKNEVLVKAVFF